MRLEKYLNEKFVDAKKARSTTVELFANPSRSEWTDILEASKNDSGRYFHRFYIDFYSKKIYFWSDPDFLHMDIWHIFKKEFGYIDDYFKYFKEGQGIEKYFAGAVEHTGDPRKGRIYSDTFNTSDGDLLTFATEKTINPMIGRLGILMENDISWANKWVDTKQIDKMLVNLRKKLNNKF